MITGVYVNAKDGTAQTRKIEAELQSYYKLLDVTTIDIVSRKIAGKYYDIVCDDEALLKDKPIVTMVSPKMEPMLCGNLFIVNRGKAGELASLTPADVKRVKGEFITVLTTRGIRALMRGDY